MRNLVVGYEVARRNDEPPDMAVGVKEDERNETNGLTEKVRPSMQTGKAGGNRKAKGTSPPRFSLIETGGALGFLSKAMEIHDCKVRRHGDITCHINLNPAFA